MTVHQLLYASGASRPVRDADIEQILSKSRSRNATLGITGMLLLTEDTLIQVLEGDAAQVRKLVRIIERDPRHRNFMILFERDAGERAFADWQMGFKRVNPDRMPDGSVFQSSRTELERRISKGDGGLMFDTVLAFARQDFLAEA